MTFIAARYDRSRSVTIALGRPYRFIARLRNLSAAEIRKRCIHHQSYSLWRWHLDEVFVRINGEIHYLWRSVDHEGEVLEVLATKRRDRRAALKFLKPICSDKAGS